MQFDGSKKNGLNSPCIVFCVDLYRLIKINNYVSIVSGEPCASCVVACPAIQNLRNSLMVPKKAT